MSDETQTIKVRAIDLGYYEHNLRYRGDVFTLIPRETVVMDLAMQRPILHQHDHNCEPHCKLEGQPVKTIITAEQQFAAEWMERVDDDEEERVTGIDEALKAKNQEMLAAKRPRRSRE
jgi:hypothetical protein